MNHEEAERLSARDNPLLQRIRKLGAEPAAYRKLGSIWLEGDHLVDAALRRGWALEVLVMTESAWRERVDWRVWADHAGRCVQLPEALFRSLSTLESPARIGALVAWPASPALLSDQPGVVLDRLQDAGNVGSILRSAAAFGVKQVLALKGTAALWSPKVLRAGMGAHFALQLVEGLLPEDLAPLQLPLLATSSHAGLVLGESQLPQPCNWVLGHEGQGIDAALMARCSHTVSIPQPGGEESLNVAAAAAICLFATRHR
ncbi:RNA methyltransferase [Ideonella azotifigens]|uniref:RNA methyltransferase n=1 Tax=Ideonella azotifigens TaxID=513160 RepID=A0ABP3VFR8_9BURK|nr:RNA methyltransferase [Ideonella azotifigens]MCD2343948.1 RNA methyltransferase [Ideonella azotifigens]